MELFPANDLRLTNSFDHIVIRYLADTTFSEGNHASSSYPGITPEGVDVLKSMSIYVPSGVGFSVLGKMATVEKRLSRSISY